MNKKKIIGFAIGPLGSAAIGFITLPLVAWIYTPEDVGRISMLQLIVSFATLLCSLGLEQSYTREYHNTNNKQRLLKQTLLPGIILSLVFSITIISIKPDTLSLWLYGNSSIYLSVISLFCIIASIISIFLSLVLRMGEHAIIYSMNHLASKILFLIAILLITMFNWNKDIFSLITAHTIAILSTLILLILSTRKECILFIKEPFYFRELNRLLRYSLPLAVSGLAYWGLSALDKIFLRYLSTFTELGVYSLTIGIAGAVTIFTSIFNIVWAPIIFRWESENIAHIKLPDISEYFLASIYFIIIATGLFSWLLTYILPSNYISIQYLLPICVMPILLYTFSDIVGIGILISRKTHFIMYITIFTMIMNSIGNYILIPIWGALGAAISTALSFYIFFFLKMYISAKIWHNLPCKNSSVILTILLLASLAHALNIYKKNNWLIIIWAILFISGIIIFKSPIKHLLSTLKKIKAHPFSHRP